MRRDVGEIARIGGERVLGRPALGHLHVEE
jgi:hypothetical protein